MNFYLSAALSLCIIFPAVIGLVRFSKINEAYYPFIYCTCLGALNEITSVAIVMTKHPNMINGNIYLLLEAILITWQFKKWNLFGRKNGLFNGILIGLVILWLFENFILSTINSFDSYFRISYSAMITFMSISMINHQIIVERRSLLKNPIFIICSTFVLYYTLNVLFEAFWIYGINGNKSFRENVYYITVITNFISIILYSLSIIWMPIKHRFTLPSS